MSGPARRVSLISLLLAALALGACGGSNGRDEKNAYVRQVNAAQTEFAESARSLAQKGIPKQSTDAKIRYVQRFGVTIDRVVAKLRDIEVPDYLRTEHQQLVDVMSGFGTDVQQVTRALRGGDGRKIAAADLSFEKAQQSVGVRADAALAAINSKLAAS